MEKLRIFLSHSHKDNGFGIQLAKDLRAAFGDEDAVWYDASVGLKSGDPFWQVIERELTLRPIFLVVLTPAAVASKAVQMEVEMALGQSAGPDEKLVIPVRLAPCEIRPMLSRIQYEDFAPPKPYEEALNSLVQRLRVWVADSEKREAKGAQPAVGDIRPTEQWTPQQCKLRAVVRLECRRNLLKVKQAWWSVHYGPPLEGGTEEMAFEMRSRVSELLAPTWVFRPLTDNSMAEAFSVDEIDALHDLYEGLRRLDELQKALAELFKKPLATDIVVGRLNQAALVLIGVTLNTADKRKLDFRLNQFNVISEVPFTSWDGLCNQILQRDNPIRSDDTPQVP